MQASVMGLLMCLVVLMTCYECLHAADRAVRGLEADRAFREAAAQLTWAMDCLDAELRNQRRLLQAARRRRDRAQIQETMAFLRSERRRGQGKKGIGRKSAGRHATLYPEHVYSSLITVG